MGSMISLSAGRIDIDWGKNVKRAAIIGRLLVR